MCRARGRRWTLALWRRRHAAIRVSLAPIVRSLLLHSVALAPAAVRLELSLQGYSTQEISEQLGRAERSVRRLRERVRKQLERLQDADAP